MARIMPIFHHSQHGTGTDTLLVISKLEMFINCFQQVYKVFPHKVRQFYDQV